MNKANTIPQAAERLNQSRGTIYKELNSGRLRSFKVGRRRYVSDEAIDQYIAERERESA